MITDAENDGGDDGAACGRRHSCDGRCGSATALASTYWQRRDTTIVTSLGTLTLLAVAARLRAMRTCLAF